MERRKERYQERRQYGENNQKVGESRQQACERMSGNRAIHS